MPAKPNAEYIRGHRPRTLVSDRLAARILKRKNGCWEWQGYIRSTGYGEIGTGPDVPNSGRRVIKVHRAAWILCFGEIPDGLRVCHHCDNRICVRPSHLFLGTARANVHDMDRKGRRRSVVGEDHAHARLTKPQITEIKRRYAEGEKATELAAEFGITRQYVCQLSRELWRRTA